MVRSSGLQSTECPGERLAANDPTWCQPGVGLEGRDASRGSPMGCSSDSEAEWLHSALAHAPAFVWSASRDGTILHATGKGLDLLGLSAEGVAGRPAEEVFQGIPELLDQLRQAQAGNPAEGMAEVPGGVFLDCWSGPWRGAAGEVLGVLGVAVDVTGRQSAGRQLLTDWRKAEELLRLKDHDRRLIAHEIHDGLVQDATAAQMRLEAVLQSGEIPPGATKQELERVLELVRKTIHEARQFIAGLRPAALESRGLVAAVQSLATDQPPGGPSIRIAVEGQFAGLDPLLETAIYRIVQEALTNVKRHSQSDRAEVRLTQFPEWIELEICDWGVGFDPAVMEEKRLGLKGIRERARLRGGWARVDSSPGNGTRVLVHLPLVGAS